MLVYNIDDNLKVWYCNKIKKESWKNWKKYKDCTSEEKQQINLREINRNEVVLDSETSEYKEIIEKLKAENFDKYTIIKTGSRGYHIHLFFNNLEHFTKEQRNIIRKIFIEKYNCDITKASESTLISIPDTKHFKTEKVTEIIENKDGYNVMPIEIIQKALVEENKSIEQNKQLSTIEKNLDFTNYFEKDPFFLYLSNLEKPLPEGLSRNDTMLKNLAIGCAKTGKSADEIKLIMEPLMKRIFPDIPYSQFRGWLSKALRQDLTEYNIFEINDWSKSFGTGLQLYETKVSIEKELINSIETKDNTIQTKTEQNCNENVMHDETYDNTEKKPSKFITDRSLDKEVDVPTEWLIDKWIAKGDICFIAGKAASYKTTIALHMIYAIASNKLVFNKYKGTESKILYVNEENYKSLFKKFIKRVKNGLNIEEPTDNIQFSIMENMKLDNSSDIKDIIQFVKDNNIKVIVFDSFRRFFIGEENNAETMNEIFNILKFIRKHCEVTILLIAHAKKDTPGNDMDIRDVIRGSSDIINFSDSTIIVKRKSGQPYILVSHAKNRSGEEMVNKIIKVDNGENDDMFYPYETTLETDNTKFKSEPERCAEELLKFLENNKLKVFSRNDLIPFNKETTYSYDTITKALRELKNDGSITSNGGGKYAKYILNQTIFQEKSNKNSSDSGEDLSQFTK